MNEDEGWYSFGFALGIGLFSFYVGQDLGRSMLVFG